MNLNDININSQYTCRITGTTDYVDILVLDKNIAVGVINVKYLTNAAGSGIAANTEEWVSFSTFTDIIEKPILMTASDVVYAEASQSSSSNEITEIQWGMIGGIISYQKDLYDSYLVKIADKQDKLVIGENIKRINGQSVLVDNDKTDIIVGYNVAWDKITGNIANCTPLQNAFANKQEKLVSGKNIKKINGQSVLFNDSLYPGDDINTDIASWDHVTGSYFDNKSLNTKITAIDSAYNTLSSTVNDLLKNVGTLNSNYQTLSNKYNTLNDNYSTYKGNYERLKDDYSTYVDTYDTLKTDINNFKTKLAAIKTVGVIENTIIIKTSDARLFTTVISDETNNVNVSLQQISTSQTGASAYLATGTEAQLICYNNTNESISLQMPSGKPFMICNEENAITVDSYCCGEINFVSDGSNIYVRGI